MWPFNVQNPLNGHLWFKTYKVLHPDWKINIDVVVFGRKNYWKWLCLPPSIPATYFFFNLKFKTTNIGVVVFGRKIIENDFAWHSRFQRHISLQNSNQQSCDRTRKSQFCLVESRMVQICTTYSIIWTITIYHDQDCKPFEQTDTLLIQTYIQFHICRMWSTNEWT